jgi:hypothetical protein
MSKVTQELLITKTRLPQLPLGWVARPRLSSKLVEALRYKLVLISAPAGYGKTTRVIEARWASKVIFVSGDPFYIDRSETNTMRLNFSCADEEMIREGIKR